MLVFLVLGDGLGGGIISSQSPIERLQISSPPQNNLKLKKKLIFFSTFAISLNLDENSMGIAIQYFASLCLFFRRFYKALKINLVTKVTKYRSLKNTK